MKLPAMSKFVVICPEQRRKRINLSHIAQFKHTRIKKNLFKHGHLFPMFLSPISFHLLLLTDQ